jgi:hypothetical protein
VGGVADTEAYTVRTINIISQRQYFVARCLSSYVNNVFGLQSSIIPRFMSVIRSSKTASEAKTSKTKINFTLNSWREQRLVCERKELVQAKIGS